MAEHTNPEKWSCDMCVYFNEPDSLEFGHLECRFNPKSIVVSKTHWCGKFELNRTHPKAGFEGLYKNEYSQENKMMQELIEYYKKGVE